MKRDISKIMVVLLLLISMSALVLNIQQAQSSEPSETEWGKTYGGTGADGAQSVAQTSNGGYAIAGQTESFGAGNLDFWVVGTDSAGNAEWNRTYGGASDDWATHLVLTSDGGYAIAGMTSSFGAGDYDSWLVKTDAAGNVQWNQTYGGASRDWATHVVQTNNEGYVLTGLTRSFGAGDEDCWLVRTDSAGNVQWSKTYGGIGNDVGKEVIETGDGGYAIVGRTSSFGAGNYDFWLIKTDSAGNVQWSKTYGGPHLEWGRSIVQTVDGGYAIAGNTRSFGAGGDDYWLVKTDAAGNVQWNQTYGGTAHDHPGTLVQTRDGGYAIAGQTRSFGAGMADWWLVKTDSTGNMQWNQTYGGTDSEETNRVIQTSDGGYAIAGWTISFGAGSSDFWLIKLAPEEIAATVDIDPDTLNLKSKGKWITAYVELPEGYNVSDIDVSTIKLNDTVIAEMHPTGIGDEDGDGIPDLMVKFDRAAVASYIEANVNVTRLAEQRFMTVTLTVTGELSDGTRFEGSDQIRVIYPRPMGAGPENRRFIR